MPLSVSDTRSNANDQISHAVTVIGRSKHRASVFEAIYFHKTKSKTVGDVAKRTRLSRIRVLQEAKRLSSNGIVHQTKLNGETAYSRDEFYATHKKRILDFVRNLKKLAKLPTKIRPVLSQKGVEDIQIRSQTIKVSQITVDDIDSFSKVRKVSIGAKPVAMAEKQFKTGVMRILGEKGKFQDWGGERNDLCTTRFRFQGKRKSVAFAFKGRGLKKKLTPALMGKNGDQIQRLFQSPAEFFILQYWSQIEDSVLEQMQMAAKIKSYSDGKRIYYGIIDGQDSARLIQAYPGQFKKK